jgi:hypothetical protein
MEVEIQVHHVPVVHPISHEEREDSFAPAGKPTHSKSTRTDSKWKTSRSGTKMDSGSLRMKMKSARTKNTCKICETLTSIGS